VISALTYYAVFGYIAFHVFFQWTDAHWSQVVLISWGATWLLGLLYIRFQVKRFYPDDPPPDRAIVPRITSAEDQKIIESQPKAELPFKGKKLMSPKEAEEEIKRTFELFTVDPDKPIRRRTA
jgi:hypothetical protein